MVIPYTHSLTACYQGCRLSDRIRCTVRFVVPKILFSMFTETQIQSWYAGSKHIIVEGELKYCLPIFMSIQLQKYIRRFQKNGETNLVYEWYSLLEAEQKAEVEVTRMN